MLLQEFLYFIRLTVLKRRFNRTILSRLQICNYIIQKNIDIGDSPK